MQGVRPTEKLKEHDISQFRSIRELLVPLVNREIIASRNVNEEEAFRLNEELETGLITFSGEA
jgi:hypothetical protein